MRNNPQKRLQYEETKKDKQRQKKEMAAEIFGCGEEDAAEESEWKEEESDDEEVTEESEGCELIFNRFAPLH